MSDLIERQAAIRWVKTECNPYGKPTLDFESGKKVIEHLEQMPAAEPERKWIPCFERLPKFGQIVLITNSEGNVSYGRFHGVEFWKEYGDSCWIWKKKTTMRVLAWMPLPKPYKEVSE